MIVHPGIGLARRLLPGPAVRSWSKGLALLLAIAPQCSPAMDDVDSFIAPTCVSGQPGPTRNPSATDMTAQPEGIPHGTIDPAGRQIGWAIKPRVWRGHDPQPGWTQFTPTGMIYVDQSDDIPPNVRIQVRDLKLFVKLKSTMRWCQVQASDLPSGSFYKENFAADASIRTDKRPENSGYSFVPIHGHLFHFWGPRSAIPAGGLAGVYSEFHARLIVDDPQGPDNLAKARFLGAASADYWSSATAPSGHVNQYNEDAAIARFKYLRPSWRIFTMTTVLK